MLHIVERSTTRTKPFVTDQQAGVQLIVNIRIHHKNLWKRSRGQRPRFEPNRLPCRPTA
jgi:hypothetical protein